MIEIRFTVDQIVKRNARKNESKAATILRMLHLADSRLASIRKWNKENLPSKVKASKPKARKASKPKVRKASKPKVRKASKVAPIVEGVAV